MNLSKIIIHQEGLKRIIYFFIILLSFNNLTPIKAEEKLKQINNNQKEDKFEKIEELTLIPYSEYDNIENQLRTFLGFYSIQSEKSYFSDLAIINESDSIREIYKSELKNMTIRPTLFLHGKLP